jgi:shikimate kinase
MSRCWILLGMMGAGKSAVGRALAELSGREFMDTDLLLQHRLGRPVSQLFHVYGEDAFRDHETSILHSLEPCPAVLATGGGIVVREANWPEMRRLGLTIYLKATPEVLIERLSHSKKKRPLLQVEDWEGRLRRLLEQRTPLYEQADVTVCIDGSDIADAAERVHHALTTLERQ